MNKIIFLFGVLLIMSCSSNDSTVDETIEPINELVTSYKGYYEEYFDLPRVTSTFDNIRVTPIVEQISTTESVNLLQIFANANNDNDNYVTFKVFADGTGTNLLYNESFIFKSHGATYHQSNLNFEVLTNNGIEFSAQFSGELDHWYDGEQRYVYLTVYSGSIITSF
ncbi:MAG: hypothetical protein KUG51_01305 [Urechidicola sp.]|nr:hypothetical protein [Urechidicola sp.]